jgi:hypothetical protein
MDLQLVRQPFGLGGRESFVERAGGVRVEVIHHQHDLLGVRVVHVDQLFDAARPIQAGPPLGDRDGSPAAQGLAAEEEVGRPAALVLVIHPLPVAGACRARRSRVGQELLADLVHADLWALGVVGSGVDLQHVLHAPDELAAGLGWDAPPLGQPGLQRVLLE